MWAWRGLLHHACRSLPHQPSSAAASLSPPSRARAAQVEGPPRPPPAGFESVDALGARLHALLDGHEAAPFTLQRLCEVLLEPRRQYARLDKVVRRAWQLGRLDRTAAKAGMQHHGVLEAGLLGQSCKDMLELRLYEPQFFCLARRMRVAAAAAWVLRGRLLGLPAATWPQGARLLQPPAPPGACDREAADGDQHAAARHAAAPAPLACRTGRRKRQPQVALP